MEFWIVEQSTGKGFGYSGDFPGAVHAAQQKCCTDKTRMLIRHDREKIAEVTLRGMEWCDTAWRPR